MDEWVAAGGAEIAARAVGELIGLVAISSPSGDIEGADRCFEAAHALAPPEVIAERLPCSSLEHADDLVLRLEGSGQRRVLLLGHVDTVVAHGAHRSAEHLTEGEHALVGSGTVDMKGGVVLALGVLRALAQRRGDFAEAALLLVCDEEWRTAPFAHAARFEGWDACLCFEAGERPGGTDDAVIVRRKAAGTLRVTARGRAAHAGSNPAKGRNALLALAEAATLVASRNDPDGRDHLTATPTVLRSGEGFNVVPDAGELICDLRADSLAAIEAAMDLPGTIAGATIDASPVRMWPGMDTTAQAAPVLDRATAMLGRTIAPAGRGGASDASHFAATIPLTIDGLGPRGGNAHHPDEFVWIESLRSRAEVALAVTAAALG